MKTRDKLDSKIPTTQTNTNKKKVSESGEGEKKPDMSLLKKNEFAMILVGALVLTLIIFLFFFNSSGSKIEPAGKNLSTSSLADIEKRIEKMEQAFQLQEKTVLSEADKPGTDPLGNDPIEERVTRLETAFSVKFDSMLERMGKIENTISQLSRIKPEPVVVKPKAEPKPETPIKKIVKKEKAESIFHTVQKGETLYSISKKYKTSVAAVRKLNNLTESADIYPGNIILIR